MNTLLEIFHLETIEQNIFRGVSYDLGFPNLFGGQVLGQALMAATQTVDPERIAHSCHAYFLRAGDAKAPIVYQVNRIRDGGTFNTRHIVAIQHGRPIFDMSASFQLPEDGFEHQEPAPPNVPEPETLKTQQELYADEDGRLPEPLTIARPVEIRPVDPMDKRVPEKRPASRCNWLRATEPMPDDHRMHQALLAYASDFELLSTALLPHGASIMNGDVFAASLDHALWLHRPFRMDDWLLYEMESPNACNSRGLNFGRIYDREGTLVASVAQEGLVRKRRR
ncbi:acyl-CoA thioesterase II [Ectothiorhodospiraceae bacterium WFHF3C12]|nr:acyl-CoA thioesterase II [Ectothiorhodospiraceae bacterium WFHF3C12]